MLIQFVFIVLLQTFYAYYTTTISNYSISSTYTLVSNVTYTFNLSMNNPITQYSTVQISFSNMFNIQNTTVSKCMASTMSTNSMTATTGVNGCYASSSTGLSPTYSVNMDTVFNNAIAGNYTYVGISFCINNPIASGGNAELIQIFINNGTSVNYAQLSIIFSPSILTNCSLVSSSAITGASTSTTFSFYSPLTIWANSVVFITLPPWSAQLYTNFPLSTISCINISNLNSAACTNSSQSGSISPKPVIAQYITLASGFSSNLNPNSTVSFSVSQIRNTPTTMQNGPFIFQILYGISNYVSQTCTNVYQSGATTPATMTIFAFGLTNANISGNNSNFKLTFRNVNPIPPSGYIHLNYPSSVSISYITTNSSNPIISSNSTDLTITLLNSVTSVAINSSFNLGNFTLINPPSTRKALIAFTTQVLNSSVSYLIDKYTVTISCVAGVISIASVSSSNLIINTNGKYTLIFKTVNNLVSGSFINVVFPSELSFSSSVCNVNISSGTCTTTSNNVTFTLTANLAGGSFILVNVTNVLNYKSALVSSSFTIYTYYDSGYDSLVDNLLTGLSVTFLANALTTGSVIPASFQVGASTTYTISITLADGIPNGGSFIVKFPSEVSINNLTLSIINNLNSNCSANLSGNSVNFSSCILIPSTTSGTIIKFNISNVVNPTSTKSSSPFIIYTYDNLGNMINYYNGTSISSFVVTMNILASMTATITPNNNTVYRTTTYTFLIGFTQPHINGDFIVITFPSSVPPPSSPTCSVVSNLVSISCALNSSTVIIATINVNNNTTSISFNLSSITNSQVSGTSLFNIYTMTSIYSMESISNVGVIYTYDTLTVSVNNDQNIILLGNSNITLTISNPFNLTNTIYTDSNTYIYITIPSGFSIGSLCTTTNSAACTKYNTTSYQVSQPGINLSSYSITLINILVPYLNSTSNSFNIYYMYGTNVISQITNGVTISAYCINPCGQCTSNKTKCLSCLPSSITSNYYYFNYTCTGGCENGYYANSNFVCMGCVQPCLYCTTISTCTSCVATYFLANSSCVLNCPNTFYGNTATNICTSCVTPCFGCSSPILCLSCNGSNFFVASNNSCVVASSCPAGTYANTTNNLCASCTSPCSNCLNATTNCTSCVNSTWLFNNTCGTTCPGGYYNDSTLVCLSCNTTCTTCSAFNICTTCSTSLFLSGTQCVSNSSCPAGTYASLNNNTCTSCTSPCSTCSSSGTNCSSCITGQWLLNNACSSTCPNTYYNSSSGLCLSCVSPCAYCTTSSFCTTCANGFYLTGTSCVVASSCPAGTYANTTNNLCASCTSPCSNCLNAATNCTSCVNSTWLFNNACGTTCPGGYYNDSTLVCLSCNTTCTTCSAFNICTTCSTSLFLSGTQCVSNSSCPAGTYASLNNNTCTSCTSPCSTCSSSGTNCSSCITGQWLLNNACSSTCPNTYYNSSSGLCLSCVSPCAYCTTSSFCTTCANGFYLTGTSCVVASSCPAGTYANTTNNLCASCTSPCSNCLNAATNCTSCVNSTWLFNNACGTTCPGGYYNDSTLVCLSCNTTCTTCSAFNICTTCSTSLFLTGTQCVSNSSCPAGTYASLNNNTCTSCTSPCSTCSSSGTNCSSCITGQWLLNNACSSTCPNTYYNSSSGLCLSCVSPCAYCTTSSFCTTCVNNYFLTGTTCVNASSCPNGSYPQISNKTCTNCISPCSSCIINPTNCTNCMPYYYLSFSNCQPCVSPCLTCISQSICSSCNSASGFFNNGSCVSSCPNGYYGNTTTNTCQLLICQSTCASCTSPSNCTLCNINYYLYSGYCYSSCPPQAPIIGNNFTCIACDSSCLTCSIFNYNCTSCKNNMYLWRYQCVSSCPPGLVSIISNGSCIEPLIGSIIFFPNLIILIVFAIIIYYSKHKYPDTQFITSMSAIASILQFISWNIYTYILLSDQQLTNKLIYFYVGLIIILTSLILGSLFVGYVTGYIQPNDLGYKLWEQLQTNNRKSMIIVDVFTIFTFRFHRLIYSKVFSQIWFNIFYAQGSELLTLVKRITYGSIICCSLPMILDSAMTLYKKTIMDQTYFCSIEVIILGIITIIFLIIDCQKDLQSFEAVRQSLGIPPNYNDLSQDSSVIIEQKRLRRNSFQNKEFLNSWEKQIYANRRRCKSGYINRDQQDKIFRTIKFADPNKYGFLNVLEQPKQEKQKSLPEYDQLFRLGQNIDKDKKAALRDKKRKMLESLDHVIQEEDQKQKQQRLRKEKQEQEIRQRLKRQDQQRLRNIQIQIQRKRREQQLQRQRRRKQQQDALQQVDVTFFDKMIINKQLGLFGDKQQSPLSLLKKFKSTKDKQIQEKELKRLDEWSNFNGLNKQFMRKLFGKQKYYNPQLLKKFLGKYSRFPKDLTQKIFNENNDPQILRALFGKDAKTDPEKIKQLLGPDQQGLFDQVLFKRLFSQQEGLSPGLTKQVFDKQGKLTQQLTQKILNQNSIIKNRTLQQIFNKQNPVELSKLSKVVGENGENQEIMKNLLSNQSVLIPERVTDVINQMKPELIQKIFSENNQENRNIIEQLLNDKGVDPKIISKLLKNQLNFNTIKKLLESNDPIVIQNLKRLIKQSPNLDQKLLQQFLSKPQMIEKLFKINLDPSLINKLLAVDSNTNLDLFQDVILNTSQQNLKQMFEFSPEKKNLNFESIKILFEKDNKTDPELIKKLFENPSLFIDLYTKGNNDPYILKKLFEKGRDFNPEMILKLYGKQKNPFFLQNYEIKKQIKKNQDHDFHSMKNVQDQKMQKLKNNQMINMSRTDGLNFLKPRNFLNVQELGSQANLITNQDPSDDEQQEKDDGQQIIANRKVKTKLKKKLPRLKPKKPIDIRLDAQAIYLQRIQAPNQKKANEIRKKKNKKKAGNLVMDEDNDVFDLGF